MWLVQFVGAVFRMQILRNTIKSKALMQKHVALCVFVWVCMRVVKK